MLICHSRILHLSEGMGMERDKLEAPVGELEAQVQKLLEGEFKLKRELYSGEDFASFSKHILSATNVSDILLDLMCFIMGTYRVEEARANFIGVHEVHDFLVKDGKLTNDSSWGMNIRHGKISTDNDVVFIDADTSHEEWLELANIFALNKNRRKKYVIFSFSCGPYSRAILLFKCLNQTRFDVTRADMDFLRMLHRVIFPILEEIQNVPPKLTTKESILF